MIKIWDRVDSYSTGSTKETSALFHSIKGLWGKQALKKKRGWEQQKLWHRKTECNLRLHVTWGRKWEPKGGTCQPPQRSLSIVLWRNSNWAVTGCFTKQPEKGHHLFIYSLIIHDRKLNVRIDEELANHQARETALQVHKCEDVSSSPTTQAWKLGIVM